MQKSSLEDIEKVVEQAVVCRFVNEHFSHKTFVEYVNKGKNPDPTDLLKNEEFERFKELLKSLPVTTLRELTVMYVIGRRDFGLEEWDEALAWSNADIADPQEYLWKNCWNLGRCLVQFLVQLVLRTETGLLES